MLLIVGVATTAAIFILHRDNLKLRAEAADLRHQNEAAVRLREENRHARELLARSESSEGDAKQALRVELIRLRAEAAELEQKAHAAVAGNPADARVSTENRDPEKGSARLEDFKNVGRSTPNAALQTLVWAALKGDARTLVTALSITGSARGKAEALLSSLPEAARAKYPTPESLAMLVVTDEILGYETAVQMTGTTLTDAQHAIVRVRLAESGKEEKVPVELGADGWKIVVPEKMIDKLKRRISPAPAQPLPKK